jgi:hypothetical protein
VASKASIIAVGSLSRSQNLSCIIDRTASIRHFGWRVMEHREDRVEALRYHDSGSRTESSRAHSDLLP